MVLTAHLVLATAVSASARFSLPAAFAFGFISHHLLDFIPHVDAGYFWPIRERRTGVMPNLVRIFIAVDILASLGWLIWLNRGWGAEWPLLFWASFGASLPDLIVTGFPFFIPRLRDWPILKRYEKFHYSFFQYAAIQENWILGISTTIFIISVSVAILFL